MNRNAAIWLTEFDLKRLRHLIASRDMRAQGLQSGIDALEEILDLGQIVEPHQIPHNVVTMNSRVVFEDLKTHEQRAITIAYPEETDPDSGRISILSPVGLALLGLTEGAEAELPLPRGQTARIRLKEVAYQPEASGEYAL